MFMLGKLKLYAALLGAAALAVVTVYFRGRADGKADLEYKIKDKRLEDLLVERKVSNEIEILDDDGLVSRSSRWVREDNGR